MFFSTLSHKANWNGGVLSGGSILEWALRQEINTCCSCDPNVTELPQSGYWMMRLYIYPGAGWRCLEAENVLTMELCRNVYNVNSWSGWERLATATPPQVYALPLAAGFADGGGGGTSIYWKNQSKEVHVIVNVSAVAAAAGVAAVAVLPAGFRVDRMHLFGCDVLAPDGRHGGQSFNVTPDGYIHYFGPPLTAGDILWGHLCFVAH